MITQYIPSSTSCTPRHASENQPPAENGREKHVLRVVYVQAAALAVMPPPPPLYARRYHELNARLVMTNELCIQFAWFCQIRIRTACGCVCISRSGAGCKSVPGWSTRRRLRQRQPAKRRKHATTHARNTRKICEKPLLANTHIQTQISIDRERRRRFLLQY